MTKTFLLGLGAVKGGTTWLHNYLQSHPEYHQGVMKEIRVWETATQPEFDEFRISPFAMKTGGDVFRWTFRTFPPAYFTFYNRVFRRHGARLVGDLTPTYTGLAPETLARIRDGFARRGVRTKAVLLMRDPVERCWSQVRMVMRRGRAERHIPIDLGEEGNLLSYHATAHCRLLTDYDRAMRNAEAVFDPEDIYYGFYETMFGEAEIRRLSAFLDLPPRVEFADNRFNVSAKTRRLSDETAARIAREYREVYEACGARFPHLRGIWEGYRHL